MAEAPINYEDDFTVEDETVLSRLEERDSQGAGISPYAAMAFGANMLPSAGISDVLGYGPDMNVVGGTMPSFSENIESGNYLDAGLQTLGASGDVMLAASPFFPALMVPAAVVKGISSAGKAIKGASKANKVPDDLNLGSGSLFNSDTKQGRKLLIVSCSADKCPDPGDMEAFDRYTGDMYKSIKKVGVPEENVDLAIMSAKYGLIRRDTPIPNYNVKMDKEIAGNLLKDSAQVDRIKNTIDGYDEVVVEGSNLYKGVIKEAAGDAPLRDFKIDYEKNLPEGERSNYGSGRQKQSVGNFLRSNKPVDVYHFSQNTDPGFTQFDLNKVPFFEMGPHVGSTPKAAEDRFMDLTYGFGGRQMAKDIAKKSGIDYGTALSQMRLPPVSGNVGYGKQFNQPIPRKTLGGSIPLKANLSKPFLNPKTDKPFTESGLNDYQAEQYSIFKGENFTADDILGEDPRVNVQDVKQFIRSHAKELAAKGFTHVPYENVVEGVGDLSYVMLTDRPKDSAAVLKGKFGKNDPTQRTNPDIMKEDGGVISLKDKAVNMNRGPRGIEPYIQYMKNGGEPKYEQGQDLGDVEMRADLEPYLYGNPLARLGYELYKEGKIDVQGVVSDSSAGSQRSYGLFSKDRGEIGYIADQREDSPDPLRILTHELAHAAMDFIEGKDQAGREGFNKYGNVDYEERMVRGGDVLIDQRSPSGEKLAQNYFGRLKPTTQDMRKFMNVSKVAQEALDKKGLPPEVIAEGDTGFSGTSGNRLLSNTDKLKRFFIGKFMNPERNVNNYLNLTGEDIRKAEGGIIGLKDKAVNMYRPMV